MRYEAVKTSKERKEGSEAGRTRRDAWTGYRGA